ncbi:MAG: ParB/RepB/Spo0J family partition protein [Actinomycetota bacterium]
MARQTGLGRGLNALLDPTGSEPTLVTLPIDQVQPNPRQPRRAFDQEALDDLVRSVAQDGIMQPILVRSAPDGRYEIIAGERRWRAARKAGLKTVPAIVRRADERQTLILALVENVVREDLNPVEAARGYAALIDELDLTPTEVAERVGRSRPTIANALRLLELPDDVLDLIATGTLSEGHGRAILQEPDHDRRRQLARRAVDDGLSVRQVEALARTAPDARRAPRAVRGASAGWFDHDLAASATDACFRALGMVGRVTPTRDGCKLEVRIRSREQLEDLVARLAAAEAGPERHDRAA